MDWPWRAGRIFYTRSKSTRGVCFRRLLIARKEESHVGEKAAHRAAATASITCRDPYLQRGGLGRCGRVVCGLWRTCRRRGAARGSFFRSAPSGRRRGCGFVLAWRNVVQLRLLANLDTTRCTRGASAWQADLQPTPRLRLGRLTSTRCGPADWRNAGGTDVRPGVRAGGPRARWP